MSVQDPLTVGEEIETLIARLSTSADTAVSAEARRLVQLVTSFHGAGLARILDIVRGADDGDALVERLARDPLAASLLALHSLQPRSPDNGLIQIMRPSTHGGVGASSRECRCELCAAPLAEEHGHVADLETRRLLCACDMCRTVGGRYRVVPSRYLHRPSMTLSPREWDSFGIPVGLVFFVVDSHRGRTVASYPGPAGATESLLPMEAWPALVAQHPWLQHLAPDVEALLVRRVGDEYRCYIVPLDACYELIGRIRAAWTGFGGGPLVEREIDSFFEAVRERSARGAGVPA